MKKSVIIPTYWSRKKDDPWQEADAVYDHPTALDGEDTLGRTLKSISILNNKDFKLIIPICPSTDEIEDEVEARVREIINTVTPDVETYIFTPKNLRNIKEVLSEGLTERQMGLLSLKGYSNVRNICLYVSHIMGDDVSILIDDDEIFENPKFIDMATEFIGKRVYGKSIFGVAGYYLNKFDEFYDDVDIVPWMTYWNRFGSKTMAFDKIINQDPRLKVTPFAFGGLMVIHKNLSQMIPFDPSVTRGEDIDYLINAKMFGFDFFLDNKLNIKHLPPKKSHPVWKRFREDIYRFLYEQTKIREQYEVNNMHRVDPEDFDPYPGDFLKEDLEDKIFKTNVLLALEYLSEGDIEGCRESIKNVYLSKYEAIPKEDPFTEYRKVQKDWTELVDYTILKRETLRKEMETNNLQRIIYKIDMSKYENLSEDILFHNIRKFDMFDVLYDDEVRELVKISKVRAYNADDIIFRGNIDSVNIDLILTGSVRIVKFNDKNEEIPIGGLKVNEIIGESFLSQEKYNSTGIANEFVELLTLNRDDVIHFIDEHKELGNKLLKIFINQMYSKLNAANLRYRESLTYSSDVSDIK